MKLRFIDGYERTPAGSPRAGTDWPIVGETYEVALIHEDPGHAMIRLPGSDGWPKPGERGFGFEVDDFEWPTEPWEIVSCGYEFVTELCNEYGILTTDPDEVAALKAAEQKLEGLSDYPDKNEGFEDWRKRCDVTLSESMAKWVHDLWSTETKACLLNLHLYEDIIWPPDLRGSLATVSYWCTHMVRWGTPVSEFNSFITRLARILGIQEQTPAVLGGVFWIPNRRCWLQRA